MSNQLKKLFILKYFSRCTFSTSAANDLRVVCRLCSVPKLRCFTTDFKNRCTFRKGNLQPIRYYSMASHDGNRDVDYSELITLKSCGNITIIDVREKDELKETGEIPGSFNIPLGEIPQALKLNDAEFNDKYGFRKPSTEDKIVFSCRSGKRSLIALSEAVKAGYVNSLNFNGGWLSWEEHNKQK